MGDIVKRYIDRDLFDPFLHNGCVAFLKRLFCGAAFCNMANEKA